MKRKGYTLVQFVFFMLMTMALATLVIDIGFATLTRRQMQTAVNMAAKEALRGPNGPTNAQKLVDAVFDDDFNPSNGDSYNLAPGPDLPYYDGTQLTDEFYGSRRYYLPDATDIPADRDAVGVWEPRDESGQPKHYIGVENGDNDPSGDVVFGKYDESETDHSEDSDYGRYDFDSSVLPSERNAVVLRMRRTDEPLPVDDPDIANSGPPVPFIFGRGLIIGAGKPEIWDRIERGTIVRATAIAAQKPARVCGVAHDNISLVGLTNVQMSVATWLNRSWPPGDNSLASGVQFIANADLKVTAIGNIPYDHSSTFNGKLGYAILTDEVAATSGGTVRLVVGFGLLYAMDLTTQTFDWTNPQPLAEANASTTIPKAYNELAPETARNLFSRNKQLAADGTILTAPALVRSIR